MYPSNYSKLSQYIDYICMSVGMQVTILTPVVNCWNMFNKSQISINNKFVVLYKTLGICCRLYGNDQLATSHMDSERLTSLMSTLKLCLMQ